MGPYVGSLGGWRFEREASLVKGGELVVSSCWCVKPCWYNKESSRVEPRRVVLREGGKLGKGRQAYW